jgi:RNA polymerase sigma-70 factor (ECF subfamily)
MNDTLALDRDSAEWLRSLHDDGEVRDHAVARLHALLLRVARGEALRRRATLPRRGMDDVDDLCVQAASDAVMAVLAKLGTYRGSARFTTWACKFVIFETSTRLRRHAWRQKKVEPDETIWDRLADGAPTVHQRLENDQVMTALHRAIDEHLTERQRLIFQAAAMDDVPIDVLAERLETSRGAIYKTLHDARAKLRRVLTDAGHAERVS